MSKLPQTPNIGQLDIADSDPEDLFASPEQARGKKKNKGKQNANDAVPAASVSRTAESQYDAEEARESALRNELESVRSINKAIEGVVESLEKAKDNMETVHRTVASASTLLNTWTRILAQTEHNQRLLLNPTWQGASQDLEDIENEAYQRQQMVERRAIEEQQRREAAARKTEEDERRRAAAAPTSGSTRGRGRGRVAAIGRGGLAGSSNSGTGGYVGVGGQGGRGRGAPGRAGSGIGRGVGGTRGRARGLG
ncbi:hypothetical protein LTR50_000615 [Elasticomyces elasticus]|nr:hypothetical protein LTR50_000615 [Elasticomyces elasticus]